MFQNTILRPLSILGMLKQALREFYLRPKHHRIRTGHFQVDSFKDIAASLHCSGEVALHDLSLPPTFLLGFSY